MRYTNQDLYTILTGDTDFSNMFELFKNVSVQQATYHGGGVITLQGSTILDNDNYLISMGTKLIDDKPEYFLSVDQVYVSLLYREYVLLSNYIMKQTELNGLATMLEEEEKTPWYKKIFS